MLKKLPNIIYLHSHDTGRYISPYGYKANTPNLQRFAEEGVVFRNCFNCNPTCSPSRACLLTGEYAHSNGMLGLAHRGFEMNDYSKHIVHTLRQHGYYSALLGVQHIISHGRESEIGYDEVIDRTKCNNGRNILDIAPLAKDFFEREHHQPFFLSVGCFETHRKFPEHDENNDPRWVRPPEVLPDTPDTRLDMAGFNTLLETYDTGVGMVLKALEASGLADNTMVIITTDHGIAFPDMKCSLTDHGLGVLLMMRGPGSFSGGKVVEGMVSHVDLFPTLCEYLGIDTPARLQGVSVMPLVDSDKTTVRDEVFAEVNAHAAYEPMRCVRTERFKYIRRLLEKHLTPVLPNCDAGISKSLWFEHGWDKMEKPREELYDLMFDPQERCNLANNPEMVEVLADMQKRLQRWMIETDDPALLTGRPQIPDSAWLDQIKSIDFGNAKRHPLTAEFKKENEIP
ncbi:MAG: sulfatase [Victivallaceae bacterium]|nr:sulfatase [Victivallaceae bacterium]